MNEAAVQRFNELHIKYESFEDVESPTSIGATSQSVRTSAQTVHGAASRKDLESSESLATEVKKEFKTSKNNGVSMFKKIGRFFSRRGRNVRTE
jgi:hypothetical protein